MRLEIEGVESLQEGDEIEIGDAIRQGDIVWFDHVEPHRVVIRIVTGPVVGDVYRIERGSAPDAVRLVAHKE